MRNIAGVNQKISFQSRIRFISKEEFYSLGLNRMKQRGECVNAPFGPNQSIIGSRAHTEGIYSCTAGGVVTQNNILGIHLPDKMLMFHLNPMTNLTNYDEVENNLLRKIETELNPKGKKMKGLIVGGRAYLDKSIKLYENIRGTFQNAGAELSIIWGQVLHIADGCNIYYSVKDDTWLIYEKFTSPINYLKEAFQFINIADSDELYFKNNCLKPNTTGTIRSSLTKAFSFIKSC